MDETHYLFAIQRAEGNLAGWFPDVLGCVAAGDTLDEVCHLAAEALALHLEDDDPPAARTLQQILGSGDLDPSDYEAFIWIPYLPAAVPA